ncbi:putative mitotic apparatus protein p62-like protein [Phaeoacremonium minimum UCRPA7]|uniref:Putative mitotic apparatus protein p62-like protein n=1 Tax=Phaeoacremonium minimum (strain UCR-PA7) TaxID=1286976 RepID=R8BY60_PHAM7|nr:putative mitotic apparatus protein p62-like protein [Phaeoacremonium minimum UCRPA7]EOO04288.1 putative mitotic apparatus protein p62-like protein [Phaeoacremonium minimum UCRPA7]
MAATYMLRFPRSDAQGEYVLVQAASNGSRPLDLTLVGTDGAEPFVFSLRSDRISKYRETSGPCTEDEWQRILTAVLTDREAVEDIEVTARVQSGFQIEITFKKKIEQFSQRLGTLTLKFNAAQGIEPIDWCNDAIASREDLKAQLASANSKAAELESAVSELKDQLEALVKARGGDEGELLEAFQALLNEKKVKIRQQQRLLASANVATEQAPPSQPESEPDTKPAKGGAKSAKGTKKSAPARAAGPSRRGKRKADPSEDEDSEDGFEKMDVDTKEDVPLDDEQMTTEAEETASDTDEDEAPPPTRQRNKNGAGQAKDAEDDFEAPPSQNTRHKAEEKAPPPPRRLPFALGKPAANKPSANSAAGADSETESDDEL